MRNIVVAIGGLALVGCNPMAQADGAETLAETFHQDLSAGNCEKIFNESSREFRASTPVTQWNALCTAVGEYYGAYQGGEREGISLNSNNGVTTTEITMHTTYANARAIEEFTFIGTGEDMALFHWKIDEDLGQGDEGESADEDDVAASENPDSGGKPEAVEKPTS